VRDNAALMDATHGREIGSRYVAPEPHGTFLSALDSDPKPLRIAIWETAPNGSKADEDAQAGLDLTIRMLGDLGHEVEPANPNFDGPALAKAQLFVISANIAAAFDSRAAELGRALGPDDLEPITRRMYDLGQRVPMAELAKANDQTNEAAILFERFLDNGSYDFILSPTMARKPDFLGTMSLNPTDEDAFTDAVSSFAPWASIYNQTGAPAISLPLHWTDDGLPIGMMFGGRYGSEKGLYQLAGQLERTRPWSAHRPPIWVG